MKHLTALILLLGIPSLVFAASKEDMNHYIAATINLNGRL